MGDFNPSTCNEAAIIWSRNWIYLVWNSTLPGPPLYWSRSSLKTAASLNSIQPKGTGYIPDEPNQNDPVVKMEEMDMSMVQDEQHDISNGAWVLDQGQIETCVANAVATAYRYELKRQNKPHDFITSRLFLYYVARLGGGKLANDPHFSTAKFYNSLATNWPTDDLIQDNGCNIREAIEVISCLGAVAEDGWIYNYNLQPAKLDDKKQYFVSGSNAARPPQNACFATAKRHFTVKYSLVVQDAT
ncbi:hypothetical protein F5Y16DRAFT_403835 [Xylariaceae sp. FL0255]|nr:hypothetical protein F5Y16DRAFT_403835 [Xylariaceae sp. FL0255]